MALECLDRATRIDPQMSLAWNNNDIILDKLVGRHDETVQCYVQSPGDRSQVMPLAWTNKGYSLANMGRYK